MITSTRIGRYGNTCNSLFQFAAVIGMSKKTGLDFAIPKHNSYYDVNYECNNYSIFEGFNLDVPVLDYDILKFKEVGFPFEYVDVKVDDFTDMVGYFQSEKYFKNVTTELKRQLQFRDSVKKVVDQKITEGIYPNPDNCTSIHVRLGDYTKKREFHPAQPADYWSHASKLASSKYYMIFSDDIETTKKMFGNIKTYYSEEDNPFSALYHMSLCRNNIICNSSFGWWGAWLGELQDPIKHKTIVAPKKWFGPAHSYNPKDIIPDRWTLL
tara:strand:+ start:845 stop:1648 length:804 start_codon:yes stop_codon:yes gene_type:complete